MRICCGTRYNSDDGDPFECYSALVQKSLVPPVVAKGAHIDDFQRHGSAFEHMLRGWRRGEEV